MIDKFKVFVILLIVGYLGYMGWNHFQRDRVTPSTPSTPSPSTPSTPSPSTPSPSTPSTPSRLAYFDELTRLSVVICSPIGTKNPGPEAPNRIYRKAELKSAWQSARNMHAEGKLSTEEAEIIVKLISLLNEVGDQRNIFQDRYEALYFTLRNSRLHGDPQTDKFWQRKAFVDDYRTYNYHWSGYTRQVREKVNRELRDLEQIMKL